MMNEERDHQGQEYNFKQQYEDVSVPITCSLIGSGQQQTYSPGISISFRTLASMCSLLHKINTVIQSSKPSSHVFLFLFYYQPFNSGVVCFNRDEKVVKWLPHDNFRPM